MKQVVYSPIFPYIQHSTGIYLSQYPGYCLRRLCAEYKYIWQTTSIVVMGTCVIPRGSLIRQEVVNVNWQGLH
jgi:hypothetical protein